jgi:hypothetical protein
LVGFNANDAVEAAAGQAQNLAELLGQRSPGSRIAAELTKTKRSQPSSAGVLPLNTGWFSPEVPNSVKLAGILLPTPGASDLAPIAILDTGPPLGPGFLLNPPGDSTIPLPGGEDLSPPGGSTTTPPGGIIGTPPDTHVTFPKDEPKEIVPVAAVPEPGTWATMLLGFALMGWRLRRQASRAACRRLA